MVTPMPQKEFQKVKPKKTSNLKMKEPAGQKEGVIVLEHGGTPPLHPGCSVSCGLSQVTQQLTRSR